MADGGSSNSDNQVEGGASPAAQILHHLPISGQHPFRLPNNEQQHQHTNNLNGRHNNEHNNGNDRNDDKNELPIDPLLAALAVPIHDPAFFLTLRGIANLVLAPFCQGLFQGLGEGIARIIVGSWVGIDPISSIIARRRDPQFLPIDTNLNLQQKQQQQTLSPHRLGPSRQITHAASFSSSLWPWSPTSTLTSFDPCASLVHIRIASSPSSRRPCVISDDTTPCSADVTDH